MMHFQYLFRVGCCLIPLHTHHLSFLSERGLLAHPPSPPASASAYSLEDQDGEPVDIAYKYDTVCKKVCWLKCQ